VSVCVRERVCVCVVHAVIEYHGRCVCVCVYVCVCVRARLCKVVVDAEIAM